MSSKNTCLSCFTIARFLPAIVVIGSGLLLSIALCAVYGRQHSYEASSRWIYAHVPRGSTIAGVHWDDRVPLTLPGYSPGESHYDTEVELPLYDPDSPQKIKLVAARTAKSDFIALPTQRLQGSLLRIPDEYPLSASYFRQLFAGQLGFKLIKTFKQSPTFLGLTFNDDLADESISVYDHPKVSIFKNIEHLSETEILHRIQNSPVAGTLPSLSEVMRQNAGEDEPVSRSSFVEQARSVVLWLAILEFITWSLFPIFAFALPEFPDRGFGVTKTLSLLLVGLCAWQCSSYGLLALTASNVWTLLIGFACIGLVVLRKAFGNYRALLTRPVLSSIIGAEVIWFSLFALFITLRAFQPEIFWGEKPMDFTFLNYFVRLDLMPPQDPWAAGEPLHYYYLGVFIFALLHKLSGIPTAIGYNLSLATLAAMVGSGAYCIFRRFGLGIRDAILCGAGLLLLANLEVLRLAFYGRDAINFDLFWASTRLFTSPSFAEYPLWALLFGDLHAHVIALPFAVAAIALCAVQFNISRYSQPVTLLRAALTGVTLGGLFLINTWDLIAYGVMLGTVLLFRLLRDRRFKSVLVDGLVIAGFAAASVIPFLQTSADALKPSWGWVQSFEFNTSWQDLRHFGLWVVIAVSGTALLPRAKYLLSRRAVSQTTLVLALAGYPFLLCLGSRNAGFYATPWDIATLASILMLCGGLLAVSKGDVAAKNFAGVAILVAGGILCSAEFLFLQDRMNTIFKFYNPVWLLLATGTLTLLPSVMKSFSSALFPAIALFVALSGTVIDIYAMTTFHRVQSSRPTLDGEEYMTENAAFASDFAAISWVNSHIEGVPIMLEAQGDSYREFTRIAMHTGLPTVLGWDFHVSQRGTPQVDIFERKLDVRSMYDSPDAGQAFDLIRKYNVQLIVVGTVERQNYRPVGLQKFEAHPELFTKLYDAGGTVLYAPRYAYRLLDEVKNAVISG